MVPTINQVIKCYQIIAQTEWMKTGRPGKETAANAIRGAKQVCRAAGIDIDASVSVLTRKKIDEALVTFTNRGLSRISALSYVFQLRAVFAKWCETYYRDAGWDIPKLEFPVFRARAPRYVRPSSELLSRVKSWYGQLTNEHWLVATMMLEFAMRNGDILRLTSANFVEKEGKHYLSYVPHKTALSSGRHVCWPIHDSIWNKIEEYGGIECFGITDEVFEEINRGLRSIGFRGHKGAYELRKICIDHVYQRYGAEMAVSISGDDIRTITKYYADPSSPNIGATRIIDLL